MIGIWKRLEDENNRRLNNLYSTWRKKINMKFPMDVNLAMDVRKIFFWICNEWKQNKLFWHQLKVLSDHDANKGEGKVISSLYQCIVLPFWSRQHVSNRFTVVLTLLLFNPIHVIFMSSTKLSLNYVFHHARNAIVWQLFVRMYLQNRKRKYSEL